LILWGKNRKLQNINKMVMAFFILLVQRLQVR
jgi:hypothetical protein